MDDSSGSINVSLVGEIRTAIMRLNNGRATGVDAISAELLKSSVMNLSKVLHALFSLIWKMEEGQGRML